jgi:uncharacterized protein (TIGR02646 family)
MQFIQKQNTEPVGWNHWFTVPPHRRTYDYHLDYSALTNLSLAKSFLIQEQNGLCAYCQQKISLDNASIEHVTPKEQNIEFSTSYFNLVAVCKKNQVKDSFTGKLHCDSTRGSELLTSLIFYSSAKSTKVRTNKYFSAYATGEVVAKPKLDDNTKKQVEAFIDILNLNHDILKSKRAKDILNGISDASKTSPNKLIFWRAQYDRILNNPKQPFREFLLVYIGSKIGIN